MRRASDSTPPRAIPVSKPWEGEPGLYTGIGSRETPRDVLQLMRLTAIALRDLGWTLRTGGCDGADKAFEQGAEGPSHSIVWYLPWPDFGGVHLGCDDCGLLRATARAYELAPKYHPNWDRLSRGARALIARNVHQVLGHDCASPSKLVICWTPDGAVTKDETSAKTGGTGTAIRAADDHNVPVYNLQREDHRALWEQLTQ